MTPNHFKPGQRLLNGEQFDRVFKAAERSGDRLFTVLGRANDGAQARLGLAISRKTDRRAVIRNRIKRQVRESFRLEGPETGDYVIMSRSAAATARSGDLRDSLQRHWRILEKKTGRSAAPQKGRAEQSVHDG